MTNHNTFAHGTTTSLKPSDDYLQRTSDALHRRVRSFSADIEKLRSDRADCNLKYNGGSIKETRAAYDAEIEKIDHDIAHKEAKILASSQNHFFEATVRRANGGRIEEGIQIVFHRKEDETHLEYLERFVRVEDYVLGTLCYLPDIKEAQEVFSHSGLNLACNVQVLGITELLSDVSDTDDSRHA
jgi:hypothetical protein